MHENGLLPSPSQQLHKNTHLKQNTRYISFKIVTIFMKLNVMHECLIRQHGYLITFYNFWPLLQQNNSFPINNCRSLFEQIYFLFLQHYENWKLASQQAGAIQFLAVVLAGVPSQSTEKPHTTF